MIGKTVSHYKILGFFFFWPGPFLYWGMSRWLQNFPYRIDQGISTFILSAGLALIIALATVSFQSIKAARTNPINTLRYE